MGALINKLIEQVYFSGIVFNQSWEDPVMDREALQIVQDEDTVLSITSGGCNSLNLLCLKPKKMICIDVNPAQTYLMDLKLAGIRQLNYDDFFGLFGAEAPKHSKNLYYSSLRSSLSPEARRFWDRNIDLFQRGIYSQGKLGLFMRIIRTFLKSILCEKTIHDLFEITSIEEQKKYYFTEIAPKIWHHPLHRILNFRMMMYLAGMHPNQYNLINRHIGIESFIRERIDHLLTSVPARSNYFLAQALLGGYLDRENVPPYLHEANFTNLKCHVDRVSNVTGYLVPYLHCMPEASIDKFNLLDIFDWMDQELFEATLYSVIRVGTNSGRFIYRSTIRSLFPPNEVMKMIMGEPDMARELLKLDRSGLYSSFYVYRICKSGGSC